MSADEHVSPRQFLYHESPLENRESIRTQGLRPGPAWTLGHGDHARTVPSGVYLSPHGSSEFGSSMNDSSWFGYDKWRVDVTGLNVQSDPTQPNSAHYVPDQVPPERVRLAKKGHPDWERHI
jgi:hypothetical protein